MPAAKDPDELLRNMLAAGRRQAGKTAHEKFLGFDTKREEQLFRAIAGAHPKPVLIDKKDWKLTADSHVALGVLRCVIMPEGPVYRLTQSGVRKATDNGLLN